MKQLPPYASRFARFIAAIIDSFILMVGGSVLAVLLQNGPAPLALYASVLLNFAYFTHFTGSRWQATPGQRLLAIYIVRLDGRPLTLRDGAERVLAYLLPTLPIYTSLLTDEGRTTLAALCLLGWYLPVFLRDDRAAVHDLLCNMRVVQGKP